MHRSLKRLTAAFMCAVTVTAAVPALPASAGNSFLQVSYEETESLQEKFEDMLSGNISLFMDEDKTPIEGGAGVDARLDNSQRYYSFTSNGEKLRGKQCYIYAQAFYATAFDEFVLHADADAKYDHSEKVLGLTTGISYDLFFDNQIKPGAYLRTTGDKTGEFDGKNGHSMIILGYDYSTVTILEGNGDANGLIRIWTITYDKFNAYYLARKKRVIAHVVQPTASYYEKQFGYTSPTVKEEPPTEYGYESRSLHLLEHSVQLTKPEDGMTWTSSDPEIVSVDENGAATAHADGYVQITAESKHYNYTFSLNVSAIEWAEAGDADGSGIIDMKDARQILSYCVQGLAGSKPYLSYSETLRYDVNDDGIINLTDAQLTLCYHVLNQITTSLTPEEIWMKVFESRKK